MIPAAPLPWPLRLLVFLFGIPLRLMAWGDERRSRFAQVLYSPEFDTEHDAAAWLFERGATEVSLWMSPAKKIRGLGVVR